MSFLSKFIERNSHLKVLYSGPSSSKHSAEHRTISLTPDIPSRSAMVQWHVVWEPLAKGRKIASPCVKAVFSAPTARKAQSSETIR
jgi:hypothetical protein